MEPRLFRKKSIVIEAMQYDGFNYVEVVGFCGENCRVSRKMNAPVIVDTAEGAMTAQPHDWIIKGVAGEYYPCKPDIFEQTYEPVGGAVSEGAS